MRRDRYLEQAGQQLAYLRNVARKEGFDCDEADEVVSMCMESLLLNKSYTQIAPHRLKGFLRTAVRFTAKSFSRKESNLKSVVARLPDIEEDWTDNIMVSGKVDKEVIEDRECPFCFQVNLNEYGACYMCHTIIPSHMRTQRNTIIMSQESLACIFDFDKQIDIQKAIERLSPLEQQVVIAVGMGNETLDSFGGMYPSSRMNIWRTWVIAKTKLQTYLAEYCPNRLSKRSPEAFCKALQRLEKTHDLEG